jgi:hypothetical protein
MTLARRGVFGRKKANWYVAPSPAQGGIGSDTNNGLSAATPFATISKVASVIGPGQTAEFATGTYPTSVITTASGTSTAPITYRSAFKWGAKLTVPASNPAGTMWVNGGGGTGGTTGQYVIIDGFELDLSTYSTGTEPQGGIFCTGNGNVVQNCKIHGINTSNASPTDAGGGVQMDGFYGGSNMAVLGCLIYSVIGTGSAVFNYQCIYMATNGRVQNNICGNTSSDCISSYHGANAMFVSGNTCFAGNTGITISSGGLSAGYPVQTGNQNGRIFNNVIIGCGYGLYESGGTVANNFFSNNNTFNCTTATNITGSGSTLTNNTTTDPTLVNYLSSGLGNYRLQSGSPARATGTTSLGGAVAPVYDADGVIRSASTPSRGAYE